MAGWWPGPGRRHGHSRVVPLLLCGARTHARPTSSSSVTPGGGGWWCAVGVLRSAAMGQHASARSAVRSGIRTASGANGRERWRTDHGLIYQQWCQSRSSTPSHRSSAGSHHSPTTDDSKNKLLSISRCCLVVHEFYYLLNNSRESNSELGDARKGDEYEGRGGSAAAGGVGAGWSVGRVWCARSCLYLEVATESPVPGKVRRWWRAVSVSCSSKLCVVLSLSRSAVLDSRQDSEQRRAACRLRQPWPWWLHRSRKSEVTRSLHSSLQPPSSLPLPSRTRSLTAAVPPLAP